MTVNRRYRIFTFAISFALVLATGRSAYCENRCITLLVKAVRDIGTPTTSEDLNLRVARAYEKVLSLAQTSGVSTNELASMLEHSKTDPAALFILPKEGPAVLGPTRNGLMALKTSLEKMGYPAELISSLRETLKSMLHGHSIEAQNEARAKNERRKIDNPIKTLELGSRDSGGTFFSGNFFARLNYTTKKFELWDLETRKMIYSWSIVDFSNSKQPQHQTVMAALSDDATKVLLNSADGKIRLLRTSDGHILREEERWNKITHLPIEASPDFQYWIERGWPRDSSRANPRHVRWYPFNDNKPVREVEIKNSPNSHSLGFSDDSNWFYTFDHSSSLLQLFNARNGNLGPGIPIEENSSINAIAFASSENALYLGLGMNQIRAYRLSDPITPFLKKSLETDEIFSRYSTLFPVRGKDAALLVVQTGLKSPRGTRFRYTGPDAPDIPSYTDPFEMKNNPILSADRKRLAVTLAPSDESTPPVILVLDTRTLKPIIRVQSDSLAHSHRLAFSPDGKILYCGTDQSIIHFIDIQALANEN